MVCLTSVVGFTKSQLYEIHRGMKAVYERQIIPPESDILNTYKDARATFLALKQFRAFLADKLR